MSGALAREQPQFALMLGWALSFLLAFTLSAVPLGGNGSPFGIAVTAVIGGTLSGLFAAAGASLGYLAFSGMNTGVRYVAAVFLTFTAAYVFQELKISRKRWFMPCTAALFTVLTGLLSSFTALNEGMLLAPLVIQGVLTFFSAYFFREALSLEERTSETAELRHAIAILFLIACLLMSFSAAVIADTISLGRIFALLLVIVTGYKCGALTGASSGIVLGFAMDAAVPDAPFYAMAYAASALTAGIFSKHGRLVYLATFFASAAFCILCIRFNGYRVSMLYEVLAAGVCFLLLPNRTLSFLGASIRPLQFDSGETGLRKYAAQRVGQIGEAFRELYTTLDTSLAAEETAENITKVFDRASELVCRKCKNKNACWNTNYMDTLSAFNDTTEAIRSRGLLLSSDLPAHFRETCMHTEALVSAVNGELRGQMYRRQFQTRMTENRGAAYSQYFHVSEILQGVYEELLNAYGPDPLAQRRLLRYLSSIDVEADASVFRDRRGRMHILLESTRLKHLLREPAYLDRLSEAVGVRLCRPNGSDEGAEGRITLLEAEPYSVSVGIASMRKKGEHVSGDRGTYFKTEQGILCILLSDGMGSGEAAAKESVAAVRILERFLRTGIDPAVAMQMLNSVMLLKKEDEWGFATVDLLCIDLFSGEAAFYKYGAAPSYIRAGKTVKRIRSGSLAAGLAAADCAAPDIVKLRLKPGNIALIASDGVLAEMKDDWIRLLLAEYDAPDTKTLARSTLQAALKQYGCSDDMTVLAVKMETRS